MTIIKAVAGEMIYLGDIVEIHIVDFKTMVFRAKIVKSIDELKGLALKEGTKLPEMQRKGVDK